MKCKIFDILVVILASQVTFQSMTLGVSTNCKNKLRRDIYENWPCPSGRLQSRSTFDGAVSGFSKEFIALIADIWWAEPSWSSYIEKLLTTKVQIQWYNLRELVHQCDLPNLTFWTLDGCCSFMFYSIAINAYLDVALCGQFWCWLNISNFYKIRMWLHLSFSLCSTGTSHSPPERICFFFVEFSILYRVFFL